MAGLARSLGRAATANGLTRHGPAGSAAGGWSAARSGAESTAASEDALVKIAYRDIAFKPATLRVIEQADLICVQYAADGYSLTLRQLYYRFVAAGLLPNKDTEYKRLGSIINDARMAGLIDWDHIVDRTREMQELPHWGSPAVEAAVNAKGFIDNVLPQFRINKWANQPTRCEAWVEKEALIDVIKRPADALDIPYFACRGYNSQSNAHEAAERIEGYYDGGADRVVILHLGDHDPSGIDMSRDIEARFREFLTGDGYHNAFPAFEVRRLALNMDQVRQYNPPPNPAKMTDSRVGGYLTRFGSTSWELDALDPPTIDALIRDEVYFLRDDDAWAEAETNEQEGQRLLRGVSKRWPEVVAMLEGK
jgi:hypothetical protein